ncbi:MAG: MATE family efflux transporter [Clostridia bacterium]|nr:MATE family efflux transporter [Clostridia bacterium]
MSRTTDMTVGSPAKHIMTFAVPLILANLGQQLYMIADAAIVGRGVGVKALAAVGATDWSYWLILWTVIGLTQGFSTFVSRSFGEGNYNRMNQTIAASAMLCAAIGAVFTLIGLLAAKPLLLMLHTPNDIFADASVYLITMIAGTLVVVAYNMAGSILRALGDGKSPLVAMVIAALLNIGLDCLFVFVFKWGIFGAALASVISQAVSFLYCLICLRNIDCVYLDKDAWKIDIQLIKDLIGFGIPVALRFIILALGGIILQSSINMQGSVFIAGYAATNKIFGLLDCTSVSLGVACCTFLAQNYGAGKYDRVKHGVGTAVKISCIIGVSVTLVTLLFRESMLKLFLDVNEAGGPQALEVAVRYLTIMAITLIILYIQHVFSNTLEAMGIAVWSMYSGIAEFVGRVLMAKVVINWIGTDALFISEPVAWLSSTLLLILPYFHYKKKLLN